MGKAERLEAKIKRLRRIEAQYRNEIRRSEDRMGEKTVNPEKARRKFERTRYTYNYKIEELAEKIRDLTRKRAELVK